MSARLTLKRLEAPSKVALVVVGPQDVAGARPVECRATEAGGFDPLSEQTDNSALITLDVSEDHQDPKQRGGGVLA